MKLDVRQFTTFVADIANLASETALDSDQCKCLAKYLAECGTQSILVESDYTDSGYLVDFGHYYSRCHESYPRETTRLHFFTAKPDQLRRAFNYFLRGESVADMTTKVQKWYRGFVVIKPLPETIIGRTCLITYDGYDAEKERQRTFPVLRDYEVSIYGMALAVRSIAFQEQDNEVAACATAAIWSSLHALSKRFSIGEIPAPYEITNASSATFIRRNPGEVTRKFPTSGLGIEQVEAYLRTFGVECIVSGVSPADESDKLKQYLAAYVRAGYPMIVVGHLYTSHSADAEFSFVGLHAVTALGYASKPGFKEGDWAERIEKVYAHDDNVGPFASFSFYRCEPGTFRDFLAGSERNPREAFDIRRALRRGLNEERLIQNYLGNESGVDTSGVGRVFRKFVPRHFIVPVNAKVRFPYETVHSFAVELYEDWRSAPVAPPPLSWSIQLQDVNEFKKSVASSTRLSPANIRATLMQSLPKYLWRLQFTSTANGTEEPSIEFIIDATALRQSEPLLLIFDYAESEGTALSKTLTSVLLENSQEAVYEEAIEPLMRNLTNALRDASEVS